MFLNIVLSFLLILIMIFLCKRNYFEGFWTTPQETTYPKPGNIPICNHSPGDHHHGICTCPESTGLASPTADTCSPCPGNLYNDGTKQMCEACDGVNEVPNENKNGCRCKDGTNLSWGWCQNCQAGTAGTGGNCPPCDSPTQYQPNAGQTECTPVGAGYYKANSTTRGHCKLQFYHNKDLDTHGEPWRSSDLSWRADDCINIFTEFSPAVFWSTPESKWKGWINDHVDRRVQILADGGNAPHSTCKLKSYSDKKCKDNEQSHTGPLANSHGDKRKFNMVQSIKWDF